MLQTDLNHRERQNLIEMAKKLEESTSKLRQALEDGNDQELMIHSVLTGLAWTGMETTLYTALKDAAEVGYFGVIS